MLKFTLSIVVFLWMAVFTPQVVRANSTDIDAIEYRLSIDARAILNTGMVAKAQIYLRKTDSTSSVTVDLLGFTIDSIRVNNDSVGFSRVDEKLTINLPIGDSMVVDIYYRGIPQKDETWGGFIVNGQYAFNMGVGFTSSPHNFGRAWFPCFDNFTDRATYNLKVTTASGFLAVCGGLLVKDSTFFDGTREVEWQLNQPIPTYLASIAIGRYRFVKYTFTGMQAPIPVWLAVEAKDTNNLKASFVNLNNAIKCFEQRFGPYLFDRVGFVGVPFSSGAMEHATNIAYPLYAINGNTNYETLLAHELSHHWWGNLVTCRTAEDMWLNEGWASFCEALFLECVYGKKNYQVDMRSKLNDVLVNAAKNDNGYLPVSGIGHEQTYGSHVYKKGALMVNALRNLMGDSAFFKACKSYLQKNQFKDVSTTDLKNEFQQFTTADLTLFFNQYILTKGHYDVLVTNWEIVNGTITAGLFETNRHKTAKNNTMNLVVGLRYTDGTNQPVSITLINGQATLNVSLIPNKTFSHFVVDEETKYALAYATDSIKITAKGVRSFPNTLFSMNTQTVGDTATLLVQHHWVGPSPGNIREKGIRISTERYWSIRGNLPNNFVAAAYFNYDGASVAELDKVLLAAAETEDSLVLLYRENENKQWQVVTSGVNFQAGGNIEDKLGRFWLTKLVAGDYTFGQKDASVLGLKKNEPLKTLSLLPNPANEQLQVTLPNQDLLSNPKLDITTIEGKTIDHLDWQLKENQIIVNTETLTPGIYFVRLNNAGLSYAAKFIKQ